MYSISAIVLFVTVCGLADARPRSTTTSSPLMNTTNNDGCSGHYGCGAVAKIAKDGIAAFTMNGGLTLIGELAQKASSNSVIQLRNNLANAVENGLCNSSSLGDIQFLQNFGKSYSLNQVIDGCTQEMTKMTNIFGGDNMRKDIAQLFGLAVVPSKTDIGSFLNSTCSMDLTSTVEIIAHSIIANATVSGAMGRQYCLQKMTHLHQTVSPFMNPQIINTIFNVTLCDTPIKNIVNSAFALAASRNISSIFGEQICHHALDMNPAPGQMAHTLGEIFSHSDMMARINESEDGGEDEEGEAGQEDEADEEGGAGEEEEEETDYHDVFCSGISLLQAAQFVASIPRNAMMSSVYCNSQANLLSSHIRGSEISISATTRMDRIRL